MAELILLVFCLAEAQIAVIFSVLAYLKTRTPEIQIREEEDLDNEPYERAPGNYEGFAKDFEDLMRAQ